MANPFARPLCKLYLAGLGQFFDRESPAARAPWRLSAQVEGEIREIGRSRDLGDLQKLRLIYDKLWQGRVAQLGFLSRYFMQGKAQSAADGTGWYARTIGKLLSRNFGPHYNPLVNGLAVGSGNKQLTDAPALAEHLTVSSHESGHALHRNQNPLGFLAMMYLVPRELAFVVLPKVFWPVILHYEEGFSIGAQYEYVHRIPRPLRQSLMRQLENTFLKGTGKEVARRHINRLIEQGYLSAIEKAYLRIKGRKYLREEDIRVLADYLMNGVPQPATTDLSRYFLSLYPGVANTTAIKTGDAFDGSRLIGILERGIVGFADPSPALAGSDSTAAQPSENPSIKRFHQLGFERLVEELVNRWPRSSAEGLESSIHRLTYYSLRYAHLPKEEFIRRLRPFHGYTLKNLFTSTNGNWMVNFLWMEALIHNSVLALKAVGGANIDLASLIRGPDLKAFVQWAAQSAVQITAP